MRPQQDRVITEVAVHQAPHQTATQGFQRYACARLRDAAAALEIEAKVGESRDREESGPGKGRIVYVDEVNVEFEEIKLGVAEGIFFHHKVGSALRGRGRTVEVGRHFTELVAVLLETNPYCGLTRQHLGAIQR